MTQDTYLARKQVDRKAADALESALDKPEQDETKSPDQDEQSGPPDAAA